MVISPLPQSPLTSTLTRAVQSQPHTHTYFLGSSNHAVTHNKSYTKISNNLHTDQMYIHPTYSRTVCAGRAAHSSLSLLSISCLPSSLLPLPPLLFSLSLSLPLSPSRSFVPFLAPETCFFTRRARTWRAPTPPPARC